MANFKIFQISELVGRLARVADANRHDQVSRNVHAIFEKKMQQNPEAVVSSHDLQSVFSTFAGLNVESNFRESFEDIFKTETVASVDESVFSRDTTYESDFRPTIVEHKPDMNDEIKAASLIEIQKVIVGAVENPQYQYAGYTPVADLGGFANWNVSFNTGRGIAKINVPVIITETSADAPSKFNAANGKHNFTHADLKSFAMAYSPSESDVTVHSGLESLGTQSIIPLSQFAEDIDNSDPLQVTSLGESTPMDDSMTAKVDANAQAVSKAIVKAREIALDKISKDADGNRTSSNVQINYVGNSKFEDMPNDENTFNGVVAFNSSRATKFGTRTITIPVEIKGSVHVADAFVDVSNKAYALNATSVENFFNSPDSVSVPSESEQEAFSDAFLSSEASYNQIRKEMKESIESGNLPRANACIQAIANRFEDDVLKSAMNDYLEYVREAHASADNAVKCSGCVHFEEAGLKKSAHTMHYCNKLSVPVTAVKRGSIAPTDCVRKSTSINWDTKNDDRYTGVIKSSSISFN